MLMLSIHAGEFLMGDNILAPSVRLGDPPMHTDPNWTPYPRTPHSVAITGDFYISATEVTQDQWDRVMDDNPSVMIGADRPVDTLSWFDAIRFCNALSGLEGLPPAYRSSGDHVDWDRSSPGYRLPTEAEWEYAARARHSGDYHPGAGSPQSRYDGHFPYRSLEVVLAGEIPPPDASAEELADREQTVPVTHSPVNPWGLYGIHGNVWEWCWDWYGPYSPDPQTDPTGPDGGVLRVRRGGSSDFVSPMCSLSMRHGAQPDVQRAVLGVRVVRSAP